MDYWACAYKILLTSRTEWWYSLLLTPFYICFKMSFNADPNLHYRKHVSSFCHDISVQLYIVLSAHSVVSDMFFFVVVVFFFIYCRQEMLWQVRWWNNWSLMELMLSKLVSAQVSTVVYLPRLNCQLCWECQDTVILWFQYSTLHTAWASCRSDLQQFLMCRSTCLVIFWCVSCCLIRVCLYHASSDWCRISTT